MANRKVTMVRPIVGLSKRPHLPQRIAGDTQRSTLIGMLQDTLVTQNKTASDLDRLQRHLSGDASEESLEAGPVPAHSMPDNLSDLILATNAKANDLLKLAAELNGYL